MERGPHLAYAGPVHDSPFARLCCSARAELQDGGASCIVFRMMRWTIAITSQAPSILKAPFIITLAAMSDDTLRRMPLFLQRVCVREAHTRSFAAFADTEM